MPTWFCDIRRKKVSHSPDVGPEQRRLVGWHRRKDARRTVKHLVPVPRETGTRGLDTLLYRARNTAP